jgi:4'-phosphopantetheinyl transferase
LALSHDEVHVFCACLDQPASRLQELAQTLSESERIRAERFHFEKDRKRFIIARGLLRTILGCYLDIEPSRVQFSYGSYGKPALGETSGSSGLRFNLSHSHFLALYAVTREREIGVDIEHVRPMPEAEQIVKRFFSARENAVFCALPPSQKDEAFFNCWTRKEAYLKAIGSGLAQPLDQIEVTLTLGEPARLLNIPGATHTAEHWSLQHLTPASSYVGAVAVEGHNWRLTCWQWFD